jgi:hypothetical protein
MGSDFSPGQSRYGSKDDEAFETAAMEAIESENSPSCVPKKLFLLVQALSPRLFRMQYFLPSEHPFRAPFLAEFGGDDRENVSAQVKQPRGKTTTYLRIIKLKLLMSFKSKGLASFFSLPLYVGFRSSHLMKTFPFPSSPSSLKSYSQLTVLCSLPFGLFGNSSSFNMKVYCFPSDLKTSTSNPSNFVRSQGDRASPVVR